MDHDGSSRCPCSLFRQLTTLGWRSSISCGCTVSAPCLQKSLQLQTNPPSALTMSPSCGAAATGCGYTQDVLSASVTASRLAEAPLLVGWMMRDVWPPVNNAAPRSVLNMLQVWTSFERDSKRRVQLSGREAAEVAVKRQTLY